MHLDNNPSNKEFSSNQSLIIPVIEEQLVVTKEVVETGRIRVVKQVTETSEGADIPLLHDEYEIAHIPFNHFVEDDAIPTIRYEGDTTIIPVLKEVMVKRVILIEEIRITKRIIATTEQQEVSLRKEIVTIEQVQ